MRGRPLLLAVLVALPGATAAGAATPAAYRTQVNGICRGYTPKLKQLDAQLQRAQAAKSYTAVGVALGQLLVLSFGQDRRVEAVPVPATLATRMTPILARMKKIDGHARRALTLARAGDSNGMFSEVLSIATLAKPLNAQLDAAGLRDCGSNQS